MFSSGASMSSPLISLNGYTLTGTQIISPAARACMPTATITQSNGKITISGDYTINQFIAASKQAQKDNPVITPGRSLHLTITKNASPLNSSNPYKEKATFYGNIQVSEAEIDHLFLELRKLVDNGSAADSPATQQFLQEENLVIRKWNPGVELECCNEDILPEIEAEIMGAHTTTAFEQSFNPTLPAILPELQPSLSMPLVFSSPATPIPLPPIPLSTLRTTPKAIEPLAVASTPGAVATLPPIAPTPTVPVPAPGPVPTALQPPVQPFVDPGLKPKKPKAT